MEKNCYKNKKDGRYYYISSLYECNNEQFAVMTTEDKNEELGFKVIDVNVKELENTELWEIAEDKNCKIQHFIMI